MKGEQVFTRHVSGMIKLIGALMILISGTGMAVYFAGNVTCRIQQLNELRRLLNIMSGEIRFMGASLPDIAIRFSGEESVYNKFFLKLADSMQSDEKMPFDMLWKSGVDECLKDTCLTADDKKELKCFGSSLGSLDIQMQIDTISGYSDALRKNIDELRRAAAGKIRMCYGFGILGSLFLIIILY